MVGLKYKLWTQRSNIGRSKGPCEPNVGSGNSGCEGIALLLRDLETDAIIGQTLS